MPNSCGFQRLRRSLSVWPKTSRQGQTHLSYLEALLEAEIKERSRNAVTRRIVDAHFPEVKTLEEFEFEKTPHVPAALIRKLAEGGYLERSEPIIFLGEAGTGKPTWPRA